MARFTAPLVLALSLALIACAPMPTPPSPPYVGQCDASKAAWAIGREATADVVERIRIETTSTALRVIRPGQAVTMDYSGTRVNIKVSERNAIVGITCG